MKVEVLKPGLASTIQDLGRVGFGQFGVPKSGAMDRYSANFANILLGNPENSAVLECFLQGPALKFHRKTTFSIVGLGAEIYLNKHQISINKAFSAKPDDVLEIKKVTKGSRVYLAVSGGFQTEKILDSRSFCPGITENAFIQKGDLLKIGKGSKALADTFSTVHFEEGFYFGNILQAYPGPEFDLLSEKTKKALLSWEFSISNDANRMACPMKESLENDLENMLTAPVLPGTVQLTPSGKLIVLMRDCQTTGGYPRVLQLLEKSLNLLAQKRPGEKIGFELLCY
jgi:biotin-dependent carboxylase-like uncharacterized protein